MLTAGSHQRILARFLERKKPVLLTIDSLPLGHVAAEVTSFWGIEVNAYYFHNRDVAEAVAKFVELSEHDRNQLEWAIIDNVSAYCAWIPTDKRSMRNANFWAQFRPEYLHPTRYQASHHRVNLEVIKRQLPRIDDDEDETEPTPTLF